MDLNRFFIVILFLFPIVIFNGCGSFGTFGSGESATSAAPPSPLKVTADSVAGTTGIIQINWLPQPTANIHYTVFESTTPDVSPARYESKKTNISNPPIAYTGLISGKTYYFVVTTNDNFSPLESPPSFPAASAIAP